MPRARQLIAASGWRPIRALNNCSAWGNLPAGRRPPQRCANRARSFLLGGNDALGALPVAAGEGLRIEAGQPLRSGVAQVAAPKKSKGRAPRRSAPRKGAPRAGW